MTLAPALPLVLSAALVSGEIALVGGPPVGMDYLAYDPTTHRIWVQAGNTGNVDVIDEATHKVTVLGGFATKPAMRPGRPQRPNFGPSSVTVADGTVLVGNRGDDRVCGFDARTLAKGPCLKLASMPDGLAWVAATHEIWVTTPRDHSLTVVSTTGAEPRVAATIKLDGDPEGYAVDGKRGVFFTNLEDKDRTLALDSRTRKVTATFAPGCGAEGPRGLALDAGRGLLFVACTNGAAALDVAHGGKVVGRITTGGGVDNIDYHAGKRLLYVASPRDGTLTIARVSDAGALTVVATLPTAKGARNPVVDGRGTAYVADTPAGRLILVDPPSP